MIKFKLFHLYWERYSWNDFLKKINDFGTDRDFGIYQVYGDHPVYGNDTLLYIGKAAMQKFAKRMNDHYDLDGCQIERYTRIHLGYFCELDDISQENWEDAISGVEQILIKSHMPALNGTGVKGFLENPDENILVFNWGEKGELFSEISNLRCSAYYHDYEKYNFKEILLRDNAGFGGQVK